MAALSRNRSLQKSAGVAARFRNTRRNVCSPNQSRQAGSNGNRAQRVFVYFLRGVNLVGCLILSCVIAAPLLPSELPQIDVLEKKILDQKRSIKSGHFQFSAKLWMPNSKQE